MKTQIIVGGLLVLFAGPAAAQQEIPALTLEDAFRIARERNPGFRSAQLDIRDAEAGVLSSYGSFLPNLNANFGWSASRSTTTIGTDDFGGVIEDRSRTVINSNASQGISTSVTLFDGFRNVNNLRAAKSSVEAAEARVAIEEINLQADVARAFYQAIVASEQVDVERQLLSSAQDDLERQQRRFGIASATQVDVLTAELAVADREQSLETAINEATKARLVVLQRLGTLGEMMDFEPVGELPEVFDPTVYDAGDLVALALQVHPSTAQAQASLAESSRRLSVAKAQRLPQISANGGYSRSASTNGYSQFFDINPNLNRGFNFGLNISLPIFQRFSVSQSTATAGAAVDRAQERIWENQLAVEQQVRSALIDLVNAFRTYENRVRSRDINQRRVEMAQEQLLLGAISYFELQQHVDGLANAERLLIQAQGTFANTLVGLQQQVGQPIQRPGQ
jgi:outer membrane protein